MRYYHYLFLKKAFLRYKHITERLDEDYWKSEDDFWQLLGVSKQEVAWPIAHEYLLPDKAASIVEMILTNHPYLYPLLKAYEIRKGK
jgi:hypothetical protein